MSATTETSRDAEAIISEGPGTISREAITVLSGQNLEANTVLGKVAIGAASAAAYAGNTGNGTMGAITAGKGAVPGVYKLTIIEPAANAGRFQVESPSGVIVGVGTVAVAFSGGGLGFTLADGATDFVAGDGFDITVAAGSGKYKAYDDDATDGSDVACGILIHATDATDGDTLASAIVRMAEVKADVLVWGAGVTTEGEKTAAYADLEARNIFAR
jgi:hypothetical protein